MKSAITICLVPEASHGPFVLHEGLQAGCRAAAEFGFDGVEIFADSASGFSVAEVRQQLAACHLQLAALGTGAGWLKHKLHLCHADAVVRARAVEYIAGVIDLAGELGAPAIIGSMQGRSEGFVVPSQAQTMLADALNELAARSSRHGQPLLYEPLNRYETNLFNQQGPAAEFLALRTSDNVQLLCDLFHMNLEEADVAAALIAVGQRAGHVHWADSNRRAMGFGHTDPQPIVAALREIGYHGYLSAEVFPLPTAMDAARQSQHSFRAAIA